MADSSRLENCFHCGKGARRIYTSDVLFTGTAVEHAEFNPAFGKIVKNKRERDDLAKRHNMIEIGNEKPETVHKHFDSERANNRRKRWEED